MKNFWEYSDESLADNRMEQFFCAVKNQDRESINGLFSKKAYNEAENFDKSIDDLFDYIQGDCVYWGVDGSPVVYDSVENGKKTKQLMTWYYLNTDEQKYFVFIVDYPIDSIDPENEGIYTLMIIKGEDENRLVGAMEDWVKPGIYIPFN